MKPRNDNILMEEYLNSFSAQVVNGFEIGKQLKLPPAYRKVNGILLCGMGGSAIGGDILAELMARDSQVPFMVNREPFVPKWVNQQTLVIVSSYSGNTMETRKAYAEAKKRKAKILVITSGGALLREAKKSRLPHLVIPADMPPRCALGYMMLPLAAVLNNAGWLSIKPAEIKKTALAVGRVSKSKARSIAKSVREKVTFFYAPSDEYAPVVKRWRGQFAENAKALASHHLLPEMLHNEIEGWVFPKKFAKTAIAVFFMPPGAEASYSRKIRMAREVIQKAGAKVLTVASPRGTLLERLLVLIALGDRTSYELARLYRVNPVQIPVITAIKNA